MTSSVSRSTFAVLFTHIQKDNVDDWNRISEHINELLRTRQEEEDANPKKKKRKVVTPEVGFLRSHGIIRHASQSLSFP